MRLIAKKEGRLRPIAKKSERALAREAAEEAERIKTAAIEEQKREDDAIAGARRFGFFWFGFFFSAGGAVRFFFILDPA